MCGPRFAKIGNSNFESDVNAANGSFLFICQQKNEDNLSPNSTFCYDYFSSKGFGTEYYLESKRSITMPAPAMAVINLVTGELVHKDSVQNGLASESAILKIVQKINSQD